MSTPSGAKEHDASPYFHVGESNLINPLEEYHFWSSIEYCSSRVVPLIEIDDI